MVLKELLQKREQLKRNWNRLLSDYREYQNYFVGRTPNEAEDRFYSEMFDQSGHDVWYEGAFSLGYTPLEIRMKKNREDRNKLAQGLREIKEKIKQYNREYSK